jgi:glycosyltransferase A (GT-A) superfamily protein (DUF2064 family)
MGSDLPDLPGGIIRDALLSLDSFDSVIGPSKDGGYYLIGFKETTFTPEVFGPLPWGTDAVLGKTLRILEEQGRTAHLLACWNDVDTFSDLKDLLLRSDSTGFSHSYTMEFLSRFRDTFPYW